MARKEQFNIKLPRLKEPVSRISNYSKNVQSGVGGHPEHFTEPFPTVKELKDATDEMNTANVADDLANDTTRRELEKKKKNVLEILGKLAAYVIGVAKGDRYIASLSGFELSKEETTPKTVTGIVVLERQPGPGDGEATVRIDKGGFDMVIVELKLEDGSWRMIGGFTLSKFILKGLPSGSSNIRISGYKSDVLGTVKNSVVETVVKAV